MGTMMTVCVSQRRAATLGLRLGDSRARLKRLQAAQAAAAWEEASDAGSQVAQDDSSADLDEDCAAGRVSALEERVRQLEGECTNAHAALAVQTEQVQRERARCEAATEQCALTNDERLQLLVELQEVQHRLHESEAAARESSEEVTKVRAALQQAWESEAAARAAAAAAEAVADTLSRRASEAHAERDEAQALAQKAVAECAANRAAGAHELAVVQQQRASLEARSAILEEQLQQERQSRHAEPAAAVAKRAENAASDAVPQDSGDVSGDAQAVQSELLETMCR